MAIRTIIESVVEFKDQTQVVATFVDEQAGTKVSTGEVFFSSNATVEQVKAELRARQAKQVGGTPLVKALAVGEIDLTIGVVDPPPDPTPEQQAKAAWDAAVFRLQRLKAALSADYPELVKQHQTVDDTFLPEYVG